MKTARLAFLSAALVSALLPGCSTLGAPEEYVPDNEVVFLRQRTELGPIRYEPAAADPYLFEPDAGQIDEEQPAFLQSLRWETLLKADFKADSRLFREAEAHARYLIGLPLLEELRARLAAAQIAATPPLPRDAGEKIKDYGNGAQYEYPHSPGAKITVLDNGDYLIDFPDKGSFQFWHGGAYVRRDGDGAVLFQYDPKDSYILSSAEGYRFVRTDAYRAISGPPGKLEYHSAPEPQFRFAPAGNPATAYTFFVSQGRDIRSCSSCAMHLKSGLRLDYFPEKRGLLVVSGAQAIGIDSTFKKRHSRFDVGERIEKGLLALYLPEGIRLANFDGPELAFAELDPAWPEQYKRRPVGPFDFLCTDKDLILLGRLDAARLAACEADCRRLSGLSAMKRRTVLVPPDLESYRKLHASRPGEVLRWYPSGYETRDFIVMWPLSVPRYDAPAGQEYFFQQEVYEILAHEYVHLLVGENTGLQSPVPHWLNEGLAVYVESQLSPETRRYWEVTFEVSRKRRRLLDWELATTSSTGQFEIGRARIHYAQSYAMVRALMQEFGLARLAAYVKSFRVKTTEQGKVDLRSAFRANFKSVFAVEWEQALELLGSLETDS